MRPARLGRAAATTLAAALPLAFLAIFFALPVGGMLVRGLLPDGHLDLSGFGEVLGRARTQRIVGFTLGMAGIATVVTVLVGVPVAHALYRLALPGRRILRALVVMPFVLPTVVVGVMFRSLLAPGGLLGGLGLDGSWQAILAAYVFFNLAVVVRTVGGAWEGLDRRMEEAAAALGAEGLASDVTMLVGNGYVPGHADYALSLIRSNTDVRALFETRLAH